MLIAILSIAYVVVVFPALVYAGRFLAAKDAQQREMVQHALNTLVHRQINQ